MANQNNTREGIHSGLTQSKSDQKWSDMLNFRCSDNRTFVVPHRLGLLQFDAGLHTVIHGVGDVNYAIGSKKSYLFRGHDSTSFDRLWKARLVRETGTADQSENLKLRGSYTGNVPRNIRLTVVNGSLVLDSDWPITPEPEVEVPYVPDLNCDGASNDVHTHFNVRDIDLAVGLSAAEITIYQGTRLIGAYTANAHGLFSLFLPNNFYTVNVSHPDYADVIYQDFTVLDEEQTILVEFQQPVLIAGRLTVIQVCNSNSEIDDNFNVYLNDVLIGALDLSSNAQVGSIFIGSLNEALTITEQDFVCLLAGMVEYRFVESSIVNLGMNNLKMINTQANGNGNFGSIGIRSYLKTGSVLSDPITIADLEYDGADGVNFEFNFNYVLP